MNHAAGIAEWPKAQDLGSCLEEVRGFDSRFPHFLFYLIILRAFSDDPPSDSNQSAVRWRSIRRQMAVHPPSIARYCPVV